jgi:hypothetical protein
MSDYIPRPDLDFNNWEGNLVKEVVAKATKAGIPADAVTELQAAQTEWKGPFENASNVQSRGMDDVQEKNDARVKYEKFLRGFVLQWLAFNQKITDGEREAMGLTVRSDSRTPSPKPSSMPLVRIDISNDQQHYIYVTDSMSSSRAKPKGVHGCEIWMKIGGPAPENGEGLTFKCICTKSPFVLNFDNANIGKVVYYRVRWINSRGEQGPWSKVVSAIVAG